ncbi:MAG: response regulator [Christensenellales bacterium]
MYSVIIVDNDPMVLYINKEYVERDKRFKVVGEFLSIKDALEFFDSGSADFMLLEFCLPGGGALLIRELFKREAELPFAVITASADACHMAEALRLGALDYIVKPFTPERLQQTLDRFMRHAVAASELRSVDEHTVDFLLHPDETAQQINGQKRKVDDKVISLIATSKGRGMTAKELAAELNLSEVTARRYLKRLRAAGRLVSEMDYNTGGQPATIYRLP